MEIQFTIGEALVAAALGANSAESRDPWLVKESQFVEPTGAPALLDFVLDELLTKYVHHLHPNVKQVFISSSIDSKSTILILFYRRHPFGYWHSLKNVLIGLK